MLESTRPTRTGIGRRKIKQDEKIKSRTKMSKDPLKSFINKMGGTLRGKKKSSALSTTSSSNHLNRTSKLNITKWDNGGPQFDYPNSNDSANPNPTSSSRNSVNNNEDDESGDMYTRSLNSETGTSQKLASIIHQMNR